MMKPESLYLTLSIADRLKAYLKDCLEKRTKSGEFNRVPVPETINLLIAMINELIRQRGLHLEEKDGIRDVTLDESGTDLSPFFESDICSESYVEMASLN